MALASSIKNLVISIRASRAERKAFTQNNIQSIKALREQNHNFLEQLRQASQQRKEEVRAFMASAKEERAQNYKNTMISIRASLDSVHQGVMAIRQQSQAMMAELREDATLARQYWSMLYTDEPLPDDPRSSLPLTSQKKQGKSQAVSEEESLEIEGQEALSVADEANAVKKPTKKQKPTKKPPVQSPVTAVCTACQAELTAPDAPCPNCGTKKTKK